MYLVLIAVCVDTPCLPPPNHLLALQSVEDRELKERLETSVTIALDPTSSQEVVLSALGMLRKEIRESTR